MVHSYQSMVRSEPVRAMAMCCCLMRTAEKSMAASTLRLREHVARAESCCLMAVDEKSTAALMLTASHIWMEDVIQHLQQMAFA